MSSRRTPRDVSPAIIRSNETAQESASAASEPSKCSNSTKRDEAIRAYHKYLSASKFQAESLLQDLPQAVRSGIDTKVKETQATFLSFSSQLLAEGDGLQPSELEQFQNSSKTEVPAISTTLVSRANFPDQPDSTKSSEIEVYLTKVEEFFRLNHFQEHEWVKKLASNLSGPIRDVILLKFADSDWITCKKGIVDRFGVGKNQAIDKLASFQWSGSAPEDNATRFRSLLVQSEVSITDRLTAKRWISSCPKKFHLPLNEYWERGVADIDDLLVYSCTIIPNHVENTGSARKKFTCEHHGPNNTHNSMDCFILKNKGKPSRIGIQETNTINNTDSSYSGPITRVLLNNKPVTAQVDTGASASCVTIKAARDSNLSLIGKKTQLSMFNGGLTTVDNVAVNVPISSSRGNVLLKELLVTDFPLPAPLIIGEDIRSDLGISINGLDTSIPCTPSRNSQDSIAKNTSISQHGCSDPRSVVTVKTTSDKPIFVRQYNIPLACRSAFDSQVTEWMQTGVLEECISPSYYNNPLMVTRKSMPDGTTKYRTCIDPRALNKFIDEPEFSGPTVEEILDTVNGSRVFSTLDLKSFFTQLPVSANDRPKLAVTFLNKQYQFAFAPFGLKHLPAHAQRFMSHLLSEFPFARCYIDDIIVFSNSWEEHDIHLSKVIDKLTSVNLKLNIEKCRLQQTKVKLLGFVVDENGIHPDPEKLNAISKWTLPTSSDQLSSLLGLANYLRRHVPHLGSIAAPLDDLRNSKNFTSEWSEKHTAAFWKLKDALLNMLSLSKYDPTLPLYIDSDASNEGIGAVLYQSIQTNMDSIISVFSRKLTPTEQRYPTPKKELLGILSALRKFHDYVFGRSVTLYTDHKPITQMSVATTRPCATMAYWIDEILVYNVIIIHKSGADNALADFLSRHLPEEPSGSIPHIGIAQSDTPSKSEQLIAAHGIFHASPKTMVNILKSWGATWTNMTNDCVRFKRNCFGGNSARAITQIRYITLAT
jgi:hypothetical protein